MKTRLRKSIFWWQLILDEFTKDEISLSKDFSLIFYVYSEPYVY